MFFRSLVCFKLPKELSANFHAMALNGQLHEMMAECALRQLGPQELHTGGFVPPIGRDTEGLCHTIGDCTWIALGSESKKLPPSVVARHLEAKIKLIEEQEGRRPGARTRKRLKEDIVLELLPRLITQFGRTDAYFDAKRNLLVVDTTSRKAAEAVVSQVRAALGSFPALPLNAEVAPRTILTGWIAGEPLPEGLVLGEECELKDAMEGGAVVKCQRQDLQGDEVAKHLESGKQVSRLAFVLDDHASFVFGEDLVVRKLKLLEGALDSLENIEREDLQAELDARFTLLTGEVGRVLDVLSASFRITEAA